MSSTTRRRSSAADRRSALETRILSVIEELLRGGVTYTELSVEQIANAAGISRSTFYLYFRDKVDVLLRLSGSLKTERHAIASAWWPRDPAGGLDGLARTSELILAQDRFIDHVVTVLKEEQQAGRTPADIDPGLAARVIVQGGAQVIAQQVSGSDADDTAVARELATGYWYGVFRRAPEAAAG